MSVEIRLSCIKREIETEEERNRMLARYEEFGTLRNFMRNAPLEIDACQGNSAKAWTSLDKLVSLP
jgi:hypothetical protein